MPEVRIATRRSLLALAQARLVAGALADLDPSVGVRLVEVTTSGDLDRTSPVTALTETGAFVRAVQDAVLKGEADAAVHSCKDMPVAGPEGLRSFFPERAAPWDVLCGSSLEDLDEGARVGTGSPRRTAQLKALRPDLDVIAVRGNVDTRLSKVDKGEFDAVVLAEAGLERLGRTDSIGHRFTLQEMVPAPAQAALAVEVLEDGPHTELFRGLDDLATRRAVEAERALLAQTGAGCRSALGAYGSVHGEDISMTGFVDDVDGPRRGAISGASPEEAARKMQAVLAL